MIVVPAFPAAVSLLIAILVCAGILLLRAWISPLVARRSQDTQARQAMHSRPTPRLGGLATMAGWVACLPLLPSEIAGVSVLLILSTIPVFIVGAAEDFGMDVPPPRRLLAAAISAVTASALFDLWLPKVDVPLADAAFAFAPFAILFTVFCTSGVSHAFNLIDGVHGLASSTSIIGAVCLGLVALQSGQPALASAAFLIAASVTGFLLFNFPFGLIFLGDAGAYSIGHILAWVSVIILATDLNATAWAMVLILFWPVADTCFAIARRLAADRRADQPDRLHHHQVVLRALEINVVGRNCRALSNPLTTLVLLPFIAMPPMAGVLFWNQPLWAFIAVILFAALFVGFYRAVVVIARKRVTGRHANLKARDTVPTLSPGE